jgi:hypothetical protein
MSDKVSLPSSSYEEMVKIIKGYSHFNGPASLDDIAKLVGMNRTGVSANNKFLTESGLISGGNKKSPTDLGAKLGRALDHNQAADIKACWKGMVSGNEVVAGLVTTVRKKGGMTSDELSAHILYVSGQKSTKGNRAGANALVEILKGSGLVELVDGKIVIAQPNGDEPVPDVESVIEQQPVAAQPQVSPQPAPAAPQGQPVYQVAAQATPQIAINIQLHLPETDNPEVYQNLFKALKENLLTQGE